MGKNLLFYFIASTVFAGVAQVLGADLVIVLSVSFMGPPILLLAMAIRRYRRLP